MLTAEARDVAIFTGSNLLNRLGGVFLLPLYWQKLTPADYGVIALITTLGSGQALISVLNLDASVQRFYYEWAEQVRRRNLGALWVWSWVGVLASTALFLLVWPWLNPLIFPNVPYYPLIFLGIIANALSNLILVPLATIRIRRMPWLFAGYNLFSFAVSTGFGVLFVLVLDRGVSGMITSFIWSNAIIAVFGAGVMLACSRPCLRSPGLDEALRYAIPSLPASVLDVAGVFLDRFLLNYYTNTTTLGIYSIARRLVDVINTLHSSMKMAYGPLLMRSVAEDRVGGADTVAKVTPFYMFVYFAAALAISLFAGELVHLIGKPEYFPVVQWVPPLTAVSVFSIFYVYYTPGIILSKRTGLLWIPALINLLIMAPFGVWLIPKFQLSGLVLCRLLAVAAVFGVNLYLSEKLYPFPHRWKTLVQMTVLTVMLGALGLSFEQLDVVPRLAAKLIIGAVFVVTTALVILKIPLSELRRLSRVLRGAG